MLWTTLGRHTTTLVRHARVLCLSTASETKALSSKRVRQHVNPLARQYQEPIVVPDWTHHFADPSLPIHLDIGCARGKYLNAVATEWATSHNFVGVEIRQSVLYEAQAEATRRGLRNIAFVHANMNFHQRQLVSSFPAPVTSVSIFHPDPWMKKRHLKRRLVTPDFVQELASLLMPGTPIYVQTDVEELFAYMIEVFEASHQYRKEPLHTNPFPIPTDRETFVKNQGGNIYRIQMIVI